MVEIQYIDLVKNMSDVMRGKKKLINNWLAFKILELEIKFDNFVCATCSTIFISKCKFKIANMPTQNVSYTYHHHHHHVQEGLGLIPVPCILKMKLVPPSLPWSSYVSSSFWFIL